MKIHIPSWLAIVLSVGAGILSVLNVAVFGFTAPWQDFVTIGLAVLAALGISPLTGQSLQTVLHISHAAALSLATALTTAVVAVTTLSMDKTLKGIIIGVLTLIAGVLFGPSVAPAPTPTPPAPVKK